jgi:hypothetical protein
MSGDYIPLDPPMSHAALASGGGAALLSQPASQSTWVPPSKQPATCAQYA